MSQPTQTETPPTTSGVYLPPAEALLARGRAFGLVASMLLAAFAFVLNTTIVPPAIPNIAKSFGIDPGTAGMVSTAFVLAGSTIGMGLSIFSDHLGRRRTTLLVMGVLILGTVICIWAPSFPLLLVGRFLQGISGAIFTLTYMLLRERLHPGMFGLALGAVAAVNNGLLGADPFVGGLLIDAYGFRGVFWAILAVTVVASIGVFFFVPRVEYRSTHGTMDWWGWGFLSAGIIGITMYLTVGGTDGWLALTSLPWLALCVLGFLGFWAAEKRVKSPLIPIPVLRSRHVWPLIATTSLSMAGVISAMGFTFIVFSQDPKMGFGMTAAVSSLLFITPASFAGSASSPLAGWLAERVGWLRILKISTIVGAIGMAGLALFMNNVALSFACLVLVGLTSGGAVLTMTSGLAVDLSPEESPASVSSLDGCSIGIGTGIGIALVAPFVGLASIAGYQTALWISAAFVILSVATAFLIKPKTADDTY